MHSPTHRLVDPLIQSEGSMLSITHSIWIERCRFVINLSQTSAVLAATSHSGVHCSFCCHHASTDIHEISTQIMIYAYSKFDLLSSVVGSPHY